MLLLVIGLVVFFAIHLVPTAPDFRRGLAERFGEGGYKAAFALVSAVGLALIVMGYHKLQLNPGKNPVLWEPPAAMRHVAYGLMLLSMIALAAAFIPSPIRTMLKHPMLVAVKIWALAHLLVNGDLGSIILFGSFLAFAVYDRISVKRRNAPGPLGTRTAGPVNAIAAVVAGLALYGFMFTIGHGLLIGVPLMNAGFAP